MVSGFVLPDYPATTAWLTDEEKHFAAWRLQADVNEEDQLHDKSIMTGLKVSLKDYRLYLFVLLQHLSLLTQTFQYFFPTIVASLGYNNIDTLWLTAPVWVCHRRSPLKRRQNQLDHIREASLLTTCGNSSHRSLSPSSSHGRHRRRRIAQYTSSVLLSLQQSETRSRQAQLTLLLAFLLCF